MVSFVADVSSLSRGVNPTARQSDCSLRKAMKYRSTTGRYEELSTEEERFSLERSGLGSKTYLAANLSNYNAASLRSTDQRRIIFELELFLKLLPKII